MSRYLSALAFVCAVSVLTGCSAPETREDLLVVARRNAKQYANNKLGMKVDDPSFQLKGDIDNLEWASYYNDARAFGDPVVAGWNDKIHTLYAFYAIEVGDQALGHDARSVWIFTARDTGVVQGDLPQVRHGGSPK